MPVRRAFVVSQGAIRSEAAKRPWASRAEGQAPRGNSIWAALAWTRLREGRRPMQYFTALLHQEGDR